MANLGAGQKPKALRAAVFEFMAHIRQEIRIQFRGFLVSGNELYLRLFSVGRSLESLPKPTRTPSLYMTVMTGSGRDITFWGDGAAKQKTVRTGLSKTCPATHAINVLFQCLQSGRSASVTTSCPRTRAPCPNMSPPIRRAAV